MFPQGYWTEPYYRTYALITMLSWLTSAGFFLAAGLIVGGKFLRRWIKKKKR